MTDALYDYNRTTAAQLCEIGRRLRNRATMQAACIQSAAWVRDGVTPLERSNMLEQARAASPQAYSEAFTAWQEHYQSCPTCQAALKP